MTPQLNEAHIRQMSTAESFSCGCDYYQHGAVLDLIRRGNQIQAEIEGSQYEPYQVHITLDAAGSVAEVSCSCPYDWGGICKHSVAVLLTYIHAADRMEERTPLTTLLNDLSREQLQTLIVDLIQQRPGLLDQIEHQILTMRSQTADSAPPAMPNAGVTTRPRQTAVDPEPYRRQTRAALKSLDRMRSSEAYWHVGAVVDEVRQFAAQAQPFIDARDGPNALSILQAVTETYLADWVNLDDSHAEASGLFDDLESL